MVDNCWHAFERSLSSLCSSALMAASEFIMISSISSLLCFVSERFVFHWYALNATDMNIITVTSMNKILFLDI